MIAYFEGKDKEACLITLLVIVLSHAFFIATVLSDLAPGLNAGHPPEYLISLFMAVGTVAALLPIMWYFDIVRMPLFFTSLLIINLYYFSISMFFGMYLRIEWWGDVAHCLSSMCVTAVVFLGLCVLQAHSPKHVTLGSNRGFLLLLLFIGISLGGVWEVMEGYVDLITGTSYMIYGVRDSLFDLRADVLGAILMTIIGYLLLRKHTVQEISSTTRIRFLRKGT